jgi:hypothetical protein
MTEQSIKTLVYKIANILRLKNDIPEFDIEETCQEFLDANQSAQIAELKAKLDNLREDIFHQNTEITSLRSQLKAQDWHDASELPTEEGYYVLRYRSKNRQFVSENTYNLGTVKRQIGFIKKSVSDLQWKPITLPEGK